MSLLLGLVAGFGYGLSAFAGAFLTLPLLVLVEGTGMHASLPVALAALALCAAIAAGDAVRSRQCDARLVVLLCVGALPVTLVGVWGAQVMGVNLLATIFIIAATVSGAMLFNTNHRWPGNAPVPAALWRAPRRSLTDAVASGHDTLVSQGGVVLVGAWCGLLAALCGAPASWLALRVLGRLRPAQPFEAVGTLILAVAVLAAVGAILAFLLAPAVSGYTAGLYVLGAVAGMGAARRVGNPRRLGLSGGTIGPLIIAAALALWLAVVTGWRA